MAGVSLCNGKFEIDDPRLLDPMAVPTGSDATSPYFADDQLADLVSRRFAEPLDFPAIADAVMPGDKIAIAVEPDTPCGLMIARHVSDWLVGQGNQREQITILCCEKQKKQAGQANGKEDFLLHDATESEQMAMLVIDKSGVPLHVNRVLFDADVVIPIGTADGGRDVEAICPSYCGLETKKHIEKLRPSDATAIARMISANLGVFWQVRIITCPGEQVVDVVVGSSESVLEESARKGLDAWHVQVEKPFDMILATIEASTSQSWPNLRKAILTAGKAATPDSSLVFCTDLSGKPPATWPNPNTPENKVDSELADVFRGRLVYLASRLTQDSTEKFGFGYLESSEQIHKLINQHESCLLLREAHRVGLQTTEAV